MEKNTSIHKDKNGQLLSNYCFVCGFDYEEPIQQDEDCLCCGNHVNFWSIHLRVSTITSHRDDWFRRDCLFDVEREKPELWSIDIARQQIINNVPEEFWINDPNVNLNIKS